MPAEAMLCTIYKGSRESELYIFVARENGLKDVPEELLRRMGQVSEVMTLRLTPEKKLARADAVRVLSGIREKGYYVQLPPGITGPVLHEGP